MNCAVGIRATSGASVRGLADPQRPRESACDHRARDRQQAPSTPRAMGQAPRGLGAKEALFHINRGDGTGATGQAVHRCVEICGIL
jgi:hypothetical protein